MSISTCSLSAVTLALLTPVTLIVHSCHIGSRLIAKDSDSSQNGSVTLSEVNAIGAIPILTALSVGVSQK
eukprot:6241800-Amphidinium_carterae.1